MGAALARPGAPVWVFYGDGALGFSLAEIDTLVRARLGVVCVVGNDAGWTQARDRSPQTLPTLCPVPSYLRRLS